MTILVSKDSKGKIRVVELEYEWDDAKRGFVIRRETYQYGGKVSTQPEIWIFKGKAKRTVTEQVKLEFASHLKKYQDKGYKILPLDVDIIDSDAVKAFVDENMSDGVTDSNGFKKHMLAKKFESVATSVFDKLKYWYGSRKIDGVRCSFYVKDGEVVSASRGGQDYDFSTKHLRMHPKMQKLFKLFPNMTLDGELYIHGRSLQYISGAARLEKDACRCEELEYYIYDVMEGNAQFEDRLDILHEVQSVLGIGFEPGKEWAEGELQCMMVPQEKVTGWTNIKKLHDKYVAEGFEGIVIRDPSKCYRFGGRTNDMIKIKMYQDAEFEITGISEGLRDEDMCFTCITDLGLDFKAKPMGSREIKQDYRDNLDQIIGKMATVKFFYYSDEGKPLQPTLKCIRDYE